MDVFQIAITSGILCTIVPPYNISSQARAFPNSLYSSPSNHSTQYVVLTNSVCYHSPPYLSHKPYSGHMVLPGGQHLLNWFFSFHPTVWSHLCSPWELIIGTPRWKLGEAGQISLAVSPSCPEGQWLIKDSLHHTTCSPLAKSQVWNKGLVSILYYLSIHLMILFLSESAHYGHLVIISVPHDFWSYLPVRDSFGAAKSEQRQAKWGHTPLAV